ncbi:helix-turn-helix domain-containing protein [uncultured Nitratireductor sp.]|uniref:winged helix-turn-helix transcriptional regulator n=1 Tax=uncultured Nitratireductor sp. TaxID=520953 RepID=UPI0025E07512|nr:helix-turn-helix domain-containing protein [uncultured Nitratireductor sp.]
MKVSRNTADSDPMHRDCPGREIFQTITNRWTLLILWALKDNTRRFHELRDCVEGISERVLSQNLKTLCRSGLIDRHVEPTVPPKVSYSLTVTGRDLISVMEGITGWIARQLPNIEKAQARYDRRVGH